MLTVVALSHHFPPHHYHCYRPASPSDILDHVSVHRPLSAIGFAELNYPKLKRDLHSLPPLNQAYLLQALRWRLNRARQYREAVLAEYTGELSFSSLPLSFIF